MTDREKLIEILRKPIFPHELADPTEAVADYLLDNGVTFAKDTNVPSKWISVEDMLPKETRVPKDVLVYQKIGNGGMCVDRAWYDSDKNKWRSALSMNMKVTHWMPLPELPKED